MEIQALSNNSSILAHQAVQTQVSASFSGDLTLVTQEGDIVQISFGAAQSFSSAQSQTRFKDGSVAQQFSVTAQAASRYSISIEGDLNEDEIAAIQKLISLVDPIATDFFTGQEFDLQEAAFTLAENLGVVNRLSLSLEKTFSASFSAQQFSRLPQGSDAGGIAPLGLPNLENIRDFPALVQSVLESVFDAHSRVGQDQSLIRSYQDFLQFIQTYFDDLNASLQSEPGVSENPEDSSTQTVA